MQSNGKETLDVGEFGRFWPDMICRSRLDISMFKHVMSTFCKYSDKYHGRIELAQVFWLWIVMSCFDTVEYAPRLNTNSCNAQFTFLKCRRGTTETNLIAKFQMNPESDNISIDNLNGALLNLIVPSRIKVHFMEYFDSCMSYVTKSSPGRFDMNKIVFGHGELVDDGEIFSKLDALSKSSQLHPVSFNVAVMDPINVLTCIRSRKFSFQDFMKKLEKVVGALQYMGANFGFTHNDLHLGNLLYDKKSDEFVLIDYGRMLMSENLMSKEIQEEAKKIILMERLKSIGHGFTFPVQDYICDSRQPDVEVGYGEYTFAMLPDAAVMKRILKTASNSIARYMFMFDVMALSINTMQAMSADKDFKYFFDYFFRCDVDDDGRKFVQILLMDYDFIMKMNGIHDDAFILLLGTYWLQLYITHLINETHDDDIGAFVWVEEDDNHQTWYKINLSNLSDGYLLYKNMQLLSVPNDELSFCSFLVENHEEIEKIVSLLTTRINGGATGKKQKVKPQHKPKRSLRMDVKPISSRHFLKHTTAYKGGNVVQDEICPRPIKSDPIPVSQLSHKSIDFIPPIRS